jgi:hypothetical protein
VGHFDCFKVEAALIESGKERRSTASAIVDLTLCKKRVVALLLLDKECGANDSNKSRQPGDWSEDRIYRRDGIGAKLLDRENLAAELSGRNYLDESVGKILGGNIMRVLRKVLR